MLPLAQLEVLAVDCQATGARGHLLELGWGRVGAGGVEVRSRLVKLPPSQRVPPAVARVTGISDRLLWDGVEPFVAWRELVSDAARFPVQPAPAVAHYARFEQPFLEQLSGGRVALDLVCTHEVARRLLPELPRRSLRALAGYFGRAVGTLRRAGEHVEATAFTWRELVKLLDERGVRTWAELHAFLETPVDSRARAKRGWPMPREVRLALPDAPGLYRMLRTGGDVLYVGKATSLKQRVNSYFRKQRGVHERTLEMLSQARGLSFVVTESALEAALLEPDEIKKHHPPYNVALTGEERRGEGPRELWFASADLSRWSTKPSAQCSVGPFPSEETLAQFDALVRASPAALGVGRWAPPAEVFRAAYARLCAAHRELSRGAGTHADLLRLGARLWREGRRERDPELQGERERTGSRMTPDEAFSALEWIAVRGALALRRARWLTRLADSTLVWSERGLDGSRLVVLQGGELTARASAPPNEPPPHPPAPARAAALTVAQVDRLVVLTTELKRLVAANEALSLRLASGAPIDTGALARLLEWL